jgi:hypothetical protein
MIESGRGVAAVPSCKAGYLMLRVKGHMDTSDKGGDKSLWRRRTYGVPGACCLTCTLIQRVRSFLGVQCLEA